MMADTRREHRWEPIRTSYDCRTDGSRLIQETSKCKVCGAVKHESLIFMRSDDWKAHGGPGDGG